MIEQLNIQVKEDNPDKVAALEGMDGKYYVAADEFNQVVDKANELVSAVNDVPGQISTVVAELQTEIDTTEAALQLEISQSADDLTAAMQAAIAALVDNAATGYNTLYKVQQKLQAVEAIINDGGSDADSVVNTVSELLQVFSTYPEGVNLVTLLAGKINTSDIVNNLNQTVAGKVLDAAQGKILNDALTALTTTVNTKVGQYNAEIKATASGTNTYTATITPAITSYIDGAKYFIKFSNANTGAATINLNSLGAKSITLFGTALTSGIIEANRWYMLIYNSTTDEFRITLSSKVATQTYGDNSKQIANTEFVQAAISGLNLNIKYSQSFGDTGVHHTGNTNNTVIYTIDLPAVAMGNVSININALISATGTAGIKTFRWYLVPASSYNSSNPLSGATQIATTPIDTTTGSYITGELSRTAQISGNTLTIYPATSPVLKPAGSTLAFSAISVTNSVAYKLLISVQLGNSADTAWVQSVNITSISSS